VLGPLRRVARRATALLNLTPQRKTGSFQSKNHSVQGKSHSVRAKNYAVQRKNHSVQERYHLVLEQNHAVGEYNSSAKSICGLYAGLLQQVEQIYKAAESLSRCTRLRGASCGLRICARASASINATIA
jgi:hypothetical protein